MSISALLSSCDLWSALKAEKRDILLYGMGNGADKLLSVLQARGIPVAGVFASDGFVRGHSFHGMRVMPYAEVEALYPENGCVVLLAFGSSRPEVMALFDRVAARYPLYVPDLPVCGQTLFDAEFLREHERAFASARDMLSDEASKELFDSVLLCKYKGEHADFGRAVSERTAWDYLKSSCITSMADLGAYNGDSAKEAMEKCPQLRFILAAEPDRRNFKKLQAFAQGETHCRVECHHVAVLDRCGEADFDASGNRNAGLCTGRGGDTVQTSTLDALLCTRSVDYIKFDVEGAEAAAIRGAEQTIRQCRPALRVSLYHRPEDMFLLPHLVRDIAPDYHFYLTRPAGFPAWDLDLVALPQS